MKKIKFVEKLIEENTIKLVEESEQISKSYSQKAENSLKAAKILFSQNLLEEAIAMSYYAMFHKITSLYREIGIKCENHTASILLLTELFGIENKDIIQAKEERIDKQYYTTTTTTRKDTKELINKAEEFIAEIDFYKEKQTEEQRKKHKEIFEQTYYKK